MKKFTSIASVGIFMIVVLVSFSNIRIVAAQATTQGYTPLAPIPGLDVDQGCTSNCTTNVSSFVQNAVTFAIGIAGALAVIMIVIGGVQYASSDAIGGKSDGKSKIENALWGIILIFVAFVVLQTIDPNILNLNLNLSLPQTAPTSSTGALPCIPNAVNCTTAPPSSTGALTTGAGSAWPPSSINAISGTTDSVIRNELADLNPPITVTPNGGGECTTVGQTNCVSLDGLSTGAINGLDNLSQDIANAGPTNAAVVITGGTEYWDHCVDPATGKSFNPPCDDPTTTSTDHKPGTGAVDISANSSGLNALIASKGTPAPATNNGCENSTLGVYVLSGGTYVKEADSVSQNGYHWHVCYGP